MKKRVLLVFLIFGLLFVTVFCNHSKVKGEKEFNEFGWKILINFDRDTLSISHKGLESILSDLTLKNKNGKKTGFKNYIKKNSEIILKLDGDNSLSLKINKNKITFKGVKNYNFEGKAFAGEKRILARTKDENNNILFAALGSVSSENINKLFDIKTDTLIIFPENLKIIRDGENLNYLQISFGSNNESSVSLKVDYYKSLV